MKPLKNETPLIEQQKREKRGKVHKQVPTFENNPFQFDWSQSVLTGLNRKTNLHLMGSKRNLSLFQIIQTITTRTAKTNKKINLQESGVPTVENVS